MYGQNITIGIDTIQKITTKGKKYGELLFQGNYITCHPTKSTSTPSLKIIKK